MLRRLILFAFLGANVLGLGGLAWYSMQGPAPAPEAAAPPPATRTVLVAARTLRAGSLLKPEDVTAKDIVVSALPAGASPDIPSERAGLHGAMIRRSMVADEPLLPGDLLRPGDHGFLAAVLGPGMRAVSVGVDAVRGSAGLIWPGDRVDLVLTQQLDDGRPLARRIVGETVLADVRVIAIDQTLVQGAIDTSEIRGQARTVTLEVTPQEGERIAVATRLGTLSLAVRSAMRSPEPGDNASPERALTWGGDVSPALGEAGGNRTGPTTIRVYQGASKSEEVRF